ncbi:hypothetical protein C4D60_Mb04t22690 [Musa balbisiana]|uniref:Uncharacterized protein n=1 Tax=Musa balbisiana TaxID=52838 RepID=A0A4S8KDZ3_MUSBA|nr:hypothetical protein C4D60_Mb04t22690 [Musa balbisiana]
MDVLSHYAIIYGDSRNFRSTGTIRNFRSEKRDHTTGTSRKAGERCGHLLVNASSSFAFTLSTPRVGQDSGALVTRSPAVGAEKRRARKAEREGGKGTNAYRTKTERDVGGLMFSGEKKGEKRSLTSLLDVTSLSLAYVAPRRQLSLSLSLLSFHHIRIQWLDGSQPSEKKKREISESDPFHALKSFSAVTDNDSRAGIRRPSRL